ncbi:MAG: retropepsin-like aspartic protease [Cyanobacteria bacterium J06592_8]
MTGVRGDKWFLLLIVVSLTSFTVYATDSVAESSQPQEAFLQSLPEYNSNLRDRRSRGTSRSNHTKQTSTTIKGSNALPNIQLCFRCLTAHPSVLQQLNAIVQLKGLNFPPPRTQGQATIPLKRLEASQVFTLKLTVGNTSGEFLFDTGASTTMLSTFIVQQLGLIGEKISSEQLTSAVAGKDCPEMSANVHQLPSIAVDGVRVEQLSGLEFTNTLIPDGLSGVLGMDFLRHFDLKLNPKSQQLQLLAPSQLNVTSTQNAIPLDSRLGVMLAKLEINRQGPFTFMLDTGADTTFISPQLANTLELNQANRQPIQVIGFCGLEMAERSTLEQIKMGEFQQNNLEAVILSSPSVLDLLEVDGILGQNYLNAYQQHWQFNLSEDSDILNGSLILSPIQKK